MSSFKQSKLEKVYFMFGGSKFDSIIIPEDFAPQAHDVGCYMSYSGGNLIMALFSGTTATSIQFKGR